MSRAQFEDDFVNNRYTSGPWDLLGKIERSMLKLVIGMSDRLWIFAALLVALGQTMALGQSFEPIPVPQPEPESVQSGEQQPTPAEAPSVGLDDLDLDEDLEELADDDEFALEPIPDTKQSPSNGNVIVQEDQPLVILQDELNPTNSSVTVDSKVAPASHFQPIVPNSEEPLVLDSVVENQSPLEPIIDQQVSGPVTVQSPVAAPNLVIPNSQQTIDRGQPTQRFAAPVTPPVIRPGIVYEQSPGFRGTTSPSQRRPSASSQAATNRNVTTNSPNSQFRVPTVVQQPTVTPQYRVIRTPGVASSAGRQYIVQQQPAVTRVQRTGPGTYRVTTTTQSTRYVPVQVQRVERTPVYRAGVRPSGLTVVPVGVEIVAPPAYVPGQPLRNAIRGAFR